MKKTLLFLCGAVLAASVMAHDGQPVSVPKGQSLQPTDQRLSERARKLILIGQDAIARHDDAALDAYFGPGFVFHGPDRQLTYAQLKAGFAAYRASFTDFKVTRQAIVEQGDFIAARTTMSGTFTREFRTPFGPVPPNGRHVEWKINNVFRYDRDGRLVEEWIQTDTIGFMRQLGVELKPHAVKQ